MQRSDDSGARLPARAAGQGALVEREETHDATPGEDPSRRRTNPASQVGRLEKTGGTPESRRAVDDDAREDSERWREPQEEDEPVEEGEAP